MAGSSASAVTSVPARADAVLSTSGSVLLSLAAAANSTARVVSGSLDC